MFGRPLDKTRKLVYSIFNFIRLKKCDEGEKYARIPEAREPPPVERERPDLPKQARGAVAERLGVS
jgi:hypothetical protein